MTRWLQGIIREENEGSLEVAFQVRSEMVDPTGFIHGGILTAVIDDGMGMTMASFEQDTFYTTANLSSIIGTGKELTASVSWVEGAGSGPHSGETP